MDALVPCAAVPSDDLGDQSGFVRKRARVGEGGWVCASQGSAAAPTAGRAGKSTLVTLDTCGGDDVGFTNTTATATNSASPETENTSFGGGGGGRGRLLASDDRDSLDGLCADDEKARKGSAGRASISARRSRAAAIHNQSERVMNIIEINFSQAAEIESLWVCLDDLYPTMIDKLTSY
ncbi:hypothetical protein COCNU_10G003870 [Cocos nucifera]|uniref:Uncharacterized protein n=1 Tax=Cocos nucifera TaxID=13894 RepID=A0A8K0N835_COCNU|nr:hypothetical protein COCNU_10G003870 [Cocos nucifera]